MCITKVTAPLYYASFWNYFFSSISALILKRLKSLPVAAFSCFKCMMNFFKCPYPFFFHHAVYYIHFALSCRCRRHLKNLQYQTFSKPHVVAFFTSVFFLPFLPEKVQPKVQAAPNAPPVLPCPRTATPDFFLHHSLVSLMLHMFLSIQLFQKLIVYNELIFIFNTIYTIKKDDHYDHPATSFTKREL